MIYFARVTSREECVEQKLIITDVPTAIHTGALLAQNYRKNIEIRSEKP